MIDILNLFYLILMKVHTPQDELILKPLNLCETIAVQPDCLNIDIFLECLDVSKAFIMEEQAVIELWILKLSHVLT